MQLARVGRLNRQRYNDRGHLVLLSICFIARWPEDRWPCATARSGSTGVRGG